MALRPKSCFILHLNSYIYLHDTVFMFIQDFESSISVVFKIYAIYFNSINSNFKSVEFICFVQILSELIVNNKKKKKNMLISSSFSHLMYLLRVAASKLNLLQFHFSINVM